MSTATTATTVPAIATGTYAIEPTHSRIGFVARRIPLYHRACPRNRSLNPSTGIDTIDGRGSGTST